jgi:hypothetical protein
VIVRENVTLYIHSTAKTGPVQGGQALRFDAQRPQ